MGKLNLIIVCGLPGTGKSTLAEGISKKLKMPVFSVDPIESAIIKSGVKRNFETGLAAYLVAEALASEQLKLGLSVVIDAVSPVIEARNMWRNLEKKHNAQLIIIECVLDRNIHKQRVEARVRNMHGIAEVTWDDVEKRRKEYLDWDEEKLVIDSANEVEVNLEKALDYINTAE